MIYLDQFDRLPRTKYIRRTKKRCQDGSKKNPVMIAMMMMMMMTVQEKRATRKKMKQNKTKI